MTNKDEYIERNDTLAALLRKLEDGDFINEAGALVQRGFSELRAIAERKNDRAMGKIVIEIKVPMGKDGYALPTASVVFKMPTVSRDESIIYVDEEGDLLARPIERQTTMKGIDGGEASTREPAKPTSKGM